MDQITKTEFFNLLQEFTKKIEQNNTINALKKYYTLAEVCTVFNISKSTFLTIVKENPKLKIKKQFPKHAKKEYFTYEIKSTNSILIELGYPKLSKTQKAPVNSDAFF